MEYTRLGRSGLEVSRICLGCMTYGDPNWRPWTLGEDEARPFFRRAIEAGINFFDTANMYSLGVSEEVTGRALREFGRRDELVIATKVFFPMGRGPNLRGLSRKNILQQCDASLKRLGVDTIDLYQIHRFDPNVRIEETLEALDHLVKSGRVRHIGASSGPAWIMGRALSASEHHGYAKFTTMQNHYNLVYREEEREMIPLCESEGIALIPWSPLARGMLARPRPAAGDVMAAGTARARSDDYSPRLYDTEGDWDVVDAVHRIAAQRGVSMAEISLAWLLGRPGVAAPIIGASKPEHLEAALRAVELKLSSEECEALEAPYRPHGVRGHTF